MEIALFITVMKLRHISKLLLTTKPQQFVGRDGPHVQMLEAMRQVCGKLFTKPQAHLSGEQMLGNAQIACETGTL